LFTGSLAAARGSHMLLAIVAKKSPIDVFDYLDFRAFLQDFYNAKKQAGGTFSFRNFSRKAGLRSPNHLKRVIDGERNLTADMARRYARALDLDGDEVSYFIDLVDFNQARTAAERNQAYRRLTGFRGWRKAHRLDLAHAAYHSTWYLPAIREMAMRPDFRAEPSWIGPRLMPPVSTIDVQRALDVLLELGLLVKTAGGKLQQGEPVVTTGPETRGLHIGNYHRAMMERAAAAIDVVPAPDRDISSLTFCVGSDGLRRIKQRIQRFRQELVMLATQEDEGEQVVQLNMQMFPLTTKRGEEK
jgi:uncharacterized protein (TIGR02147 family)